MINLEKNKLIFSKEAIQYLETIPGDRYSVVYAFIEGATVPLLKKDLNGNKLTKSGTISFRKTKSEVLQMHGNAFVLVPNDGNSYRMQNLKK